MNEDDAMFWPTIVIVEGRPYVLTKQQTVTKNDPCAVCDLKSKCNADGMPVRFFPLCTADKRDDGWFFTEDWSIYDTPVMEFLNGDEYDNR